jgi:hypothetical protein
LRREKVNAASTYFRVFKKAEIYFSCRETAEGSFFKRIFALWGKVRAYGKIGALLELVPRYS